MKRSFDRLEHLPSQEAPDGFHYDGDPTEMFQGLPTRRLRRNNSKKREDAYCDLYVALTEEKDDGEKCCTYYCCITGCTKSAISMYIGGTGNKNKIVFTNFFKHLQNHHVEYLFEQDRNCSDVRTQNQNTVQHFFPPMRPTEGQSQSSPDIATRAQARAQNSQSKMLFNKIAQATAEVVHIWIESNVYISSSFDSSPSLFIYTN